jgi:hypothetical protein
LVTAPDGTRRFRRSHSQAHTAAVAEPWTLSWTAVNPYAEQALRVRIEALSSAGSEDDPAVVVIGSVAGTNTASWTNSSATGVTVSLAAGAPGNDTVDSIIIATNSGQVPRQAAWTRFRKVFKPVLNLKERQGLGLWIEGDGQGEIIALRLESPQHLAFGAIADRYVTVDFTGKRWFTLVETESARWNDFTWNDGKSLYNVYRETVDFAAIETAEVWLQNLPPAKPIKCRLGPIKALPLLQGAVVNPTFTVNGLTTHFPVTLLSGQWLEYGPDACVHYGAKGEALGVVTPTGKGPTVNQGPNQVTFSCSPTNGPSPRAKLTFFTHGPIL